MPKSILSLSLLVCVGSISAAIIHVPGLSETQVNPVGTPFTRPTGIAAASSGRVFVLEQDGLVKVVQGGTVTTALNLAGEIAGITSNEAGLIGSRWIPTLTRRAVSTSTSTTPRRMEPEAAAEWRGSP